MALAEAASGTLVFRPAGPEDLVAIVGLFVGDEAGGHGDTLDDAVLPLYEAALKWHRWWYSARDPEGTGLVALLHPWESGSDNSPAWDIALARVPTTTDTPVVRKDTGHVNASMRPRVSGPRAPSPSPVVPSSPVRV